MPLNGSILINVALKLKTFRDFDLEYWGQIVLVPKLSKSKRYIFKCCSMFILEVEGVEKDTCCLNRKLMAEVSLHGVIFYGVAFNDVTIFTLHHWPHIETPPPHWTYAKGLYFLHDLKGSLLDIYTSIPTHVLIMYSGRFIWPFSVRRWRSFPYQRKKKL